MKALYVFNIVRSHVRYAILHRTVQHTIRYLNRTDRDGFCEQHLVRLPAQMRSCASCHIVYCVHILRFVSSCVYVFFFHLHLLFCTLHFLLHSAQQPRNTRAQQMSNQTIRAAMNSAMTSIRCGRSLSARAHRNSERELHVCKFSTYSYMFEYMARGMYTGKYIFIYIHLRALHN